MQLRRAAIPQRLTVPTLGLALNLDGETESQDRCTAVNGVSRQPRAIYVSITYHQMLIGCTGDRSSATVSPIACKSRHNINAVRCSPHNHTATLAVIAAYRQLAIVLTCRLTKLSLNTIARLFGVGDHSMSSRPDAR
jgi:hypothetical protein